MRTPALRRRHRVLAACAMISAVTLGTVAASSASATAGGHTPPEPPGNAGPAIGYHPTDDAPDDLNAANDTYAACMREHGRAVFPTFHAAKDSGGGISFIVKVRVPRGEKPDLNSGAFKKAFDACKGPLEKAGVTFPKQGFPQPPRHPGKPGIPEQPHAKKAALSI
ncbi:MULTISPECIES: hypothetical protein [unclassified Streptomyces]|uniref:hypothetical protein n=1 Tax=unclassified Streptomyces TaxID=2593676 RepID=UPI00278C1D71|nr:MULTISPECIES: hypothetical protein [unclassified Streptomyces]